MHIKESSARYSREDQLAIDCILILSDEELPFTAMEGDASTQSVWNALIAGEAGAISPYVAPDHPQSPSVPQSVTMRQARLALHGAGLLPQVDAIMADADPVVKIEWEYATELRRDHPMVAAMGQGLGLDDAAINALFVQAAGIE